MAQEPKKPTGAGGDIKTGPSLAEIFRLDMEPEEQHSTVRMPPLFMPARRAPREAPVPSLQGLSPFWIEKGRGGTGKTKFARFYGDKLRTSGASGYVLAAADPNIRLLGEFFEGVMMPPSTNQAQTVTWLRGFLGNIRRHRPPGMIDMGGGDQAMAEIIRAWPNMIGEMADAGVGIVAAYFLGTAPDDAAQIHADVEAGFAPKATALVRSMHLADDDSAFNAMRSHPAYKAALERGAVEIVIPRLAPQMLANQVELRRFLFSDARDGVVPEGSPHKPIDAGFYRAAIREWMEAMEDELRPLAAAGWLPWGAA